MSGLPRATLALDRKRGSSFESVPPLVAEHRHNGPGRTKSNTSALTCYTGVQRCRGPLVEGLRMRKDAPQHSEFRAFSGAMLGIAVGAAMWALLALLFFVAW